jgi:hypothetical protein
MGRAGVILWILSKTKALAAKKPRAVLTQMTGGENSLPSSTLCGGDSDRDDWDTQEAWDLVGGGLWPLRAQ